MTIDAADVLTPAEIALARGVTRQMVYLWMTRGLRAPDGRRVRLEGVRVGGRIVVRRPTLQSFVVAVGKREPAASARAGRAAAETDVDAGLPFPPGRGRR